MNDEYYMKIAIKEAEKALKIDEVPMGAILVDGDGKIIAKAHNTKEKYRNSLHHAEILCLNKASKKLNDWHFNDFTMYVTCEPCHMCCGALINFRVKRVVFGAYDYKCGCATTVCSLLNNKTFNHQVEYTGGVLENECVALLQKFFKSKRKPKKSEN